MPTSCNLLFPTYQVLSAGPAGVDVVASGWCASADGTTLFDNGDTVLQIDLTVALSGVEATWKTQIKNAFAAAAALRNATVLKVVWSDMSVLSV